MTSRISPFLRLARTAAPLRQTLARPLRPQFAAARYRGFTTTTQRTESKHKIPVKPESYYLQFTCRPCGERSSHNISKQGYHHGSVLVTCPECKNRHVISDHLNIFGDRKVTIEQLVQEQGGIVRKGTLDDDGDIEFWSEHARDAVETVEAEEVEEKKPGE